MMKFKIGEIEGVEIIKLNNFTDKRGRLIETFRIDNLPDGIKPVMSYVSWTKPGISRGPHEHEKQTDVFTFMGAGMFKIKLWDNRKNGVTFGNKMIIDAGVDNPVTLIVPPGVVHGYKNISKKTPGMVINYPDKLYKGAGKKEEVDEIRHEDREDWFFIDFIKE